MANQVPSLPRESSRKRCVCQCMCVCLCKTATTMPLSDTSLAGYRTSKPPAPTPARSSGLLCACARARWPGAQVTLSGPDPQPEPQPAARPFELQFPGGAGPRKRLPSNQVNQRWRRRGRGTPQVPSAGASPLVSSPPVRAANEQRPCRGGAPVLGLLLAQGPTPAAAGRSRV